MNIVFMGTPEFAVPSLEMLHHAGHFISAVVTGADKRRGRGSETSPTPVKAKALELGLTVIEAENLKSAEFEQQLRKLKPDLFVVVAFRVLPRNILKIPAVGSVNLHASLLPKYRGAAPIHWAVINGEKTTGCTVFFLDEKVDTGNIVSQKTTEIGANETTGELYERLKHSGSEQLVEAVDLIARGAYALKTQNDAAATPAPKLNKENTHLDFTADCRQVHNKIRGLSPVPGAWASWQNKEIKIYRSFLHSSIKTEPGVLAVMDEKLLVGCRNGSVEILELQLPGKKIISGKDFVRGYNPTGILE